MSNTYGEASQSQARKMQNGEITIRPQQSTEAIAKLHSTAKELLPQYGGMWGTHNLVTMPRSALARVIYYNELYQKILDIPGVICEFGVQWGATLALLTNLRGTHEPFNASRKIFGFDTFDGFSHIDVKDGAWPKVGDYKSVPGYEDKLGEILSTHETLAPLAHLKKFELVKGDASLTIDQWLEAHPYAMISMAIFDMDVYKPTKDVLQKIIPRLTKGSLLVFDEFNCEYFPGETLAVQEVLGFNNIKFRHSPYQSYCAWAVFGE
ncbi:macrocin O-methyltransferase [Paraburkholderia metrosideri]|uniref:Macrocin O-methyltransferase n=1 Tax=Paraburkholderia metrosideri TaxID=580937 RepID=A0ABW9DYT1_9BURK